jgi:hypothetical protein
LEFCFGFSFAEQPQGQRNYVAGRADERSRRFQNGSRSSLDLNEQQVAPFDKNPVFAGGRNGGNQFDIECGSGGFRSGRDLSLFFFLIYNQPPVNRTNNNIIGIWLSAVFATFHVSSRWFPRLDCCYSPLSCSITPQCEQA